MSEPVKEEGAQTLDDGIQTGISGLTSEKIASVINEVIDTVGPKGILPYSYLGQMGVLNGMTVGDPFFNALGTSVTERTFCDGGAITSYVMTLGPTAGVDPRVSCTRSTS